VVLLPGVVGHLPPGVPSPLAVEPVLVLVGALVEPQEALTL
jgi:hypothetical protein